jgi:outer membrane receptor protein involved in Fe transport
MVFVLLLMLSCLDMFAQQTVSIKGKVIELDTEQAIPYASVVVRSAATEQIVAGTTTDEQGEFNLETQPGDYTIEVSFVGYKTEYISGLKMAGGKMLDLGTIALVEDTRVLDEVEVRADKSMVEFELDKRVFNVGQDLSSTGMSALDLLNNVPSVNVDIEGQISLRGNTGVQVLINGKPSVLADDGSTALGTITAEMIERIEVITNPSAKYEAEGSSGIINILLQKEDKKGFNGSVSLNTGVPANHNVGVSLNNRTEKFNVFTQFGVGYRSLPRYRNSTNLDLTDSTEVRSDGTEYRNERFFNITLGSDYYLNDFNVITLSGSFAFEDEDQPSSTNFWITNGSGMLISQYRREEETEAANPKYQFDLQYEKKFRNKEDHVLQLATQGSFFGKEQSSEFSNVLIEGVKLDPDQLTETDFYQRDFIFKLDYTNPLTEAWTIELGAQYDINDVGNDYAVYNQNSNGDFLVDSNLTNNFEFDQQVFGIYATGAFQGENWGLKVGARLENTHLNTFLITTNQANQQNYTNLFPSLHTSYKFSRQFSLQAGYSRRIYRPRLWDLNPFFNIRNNYNIRMGNPLLEPEFADSYEFTAILIFEKVSLNSSIYNLYTTNIIERVSFFENNVNVTAPVNIGTRNQTGFELNGKYVPNDWLTLNGDFNYGFFIRNGDYGEQSFDFTGTQWFTRLSARFKLPAAFEIEASADYRSPYKTVQGEVSGFAFGDIGLRKKLWKGKGVINLSVRDIFASRIRENTVAQPTFLLYDFSQRGRFITLGFSYSFGKGEAMTYTGRRR